MFSVEVIMSRIFLCLIYWHFIVYSQCLHPNRKKRDMEDCGEPLFLTLYIENGQIAEARQLARVLVTDDIGVESYAGYFTVNKIFDSNQFLWYFPSMQDKYKAPVIVWLAGGPGTSALFSQFMAHGPIRIENDSFERRELHWALNHHVIYIDNPVGAGFSFTNDSEGYCTNEVQIGEQLYSTLTQFFKIFPELQTNDFYVLGESYGGKFASALAYTIHRKNPAAETRINLQGFAMGNSFCDPERQLIYSTYLYQIGLIDWNAALIMAEYESKMINHIKNQQFVYAFLTYAKMLMGGVDSIESFFQNTTDFSNSLNYLHSSLSSSEKVTSDVYAAVNTDAFRRAIHVCHQQFNTKREVRLHLVQDIMQSMAPWISELLEYYRVLVYNGQLDIIIPYPGTVDFIRHLNFSGAEEYEKASRNVWRVNGDVAGYVKQAGKLTEILVRNAGHMVPLDQPEWARDMITRFTYNRSFIN